MRNKMGRRELVKYQDSAMAANLTSSCWFKEEMGGEVGAPDCTVGSPEYDRRLCEEEAVRIGHFSGEFKLGHG